MVTHVNTYSKEFSPVLTEKAYLMANDENFQDDQCLLEDLTNNIHVDTSDIRYPIDGMELLSLEFGYSFHYE